MNNCRSKRKQAKEAAEELERFVGGYLDCQIDKRLVETLQRPLQALLTFRHCLRGLLLSELVGYILGPEQAPAGTKQLNNLLRSKKWSGKEIEAFLWQQARAGSGRTRDGVCRLG